MPAAAPTAKRGTGEVISVDGRAQHRLTLGAKPLSGFYAGEMVFEVEAMAGWRDAHVWKKCPGGGLCRAR